ncbi:MAG: hypothetical protein WCT02_02095 [Candidatus Paceibacterota bacterium]|jgi:hypothetical protein
MTKYVLNSGGMRNKPDLAKKFFAEVLKGLGKEPQILTCYFARPRQDWEQLFKQDQEELPKIFPEGVKPILELAFPATFEEQIRRSEVIFLRGGDDHLIQYWLRQFDLPKIWEGKVVATNSASSHALAKYFWTCDWREKMNGLGILSLKFLAHYQSFYGNNDPRGPVDWEKAYEELKSYGDQTLPIYALKEGEYVVVEK